MKYAPEFYNVSAGDVDVNITQTAGMLTATFKLGSNKVMPFAVAPWVGKEDLPADLPNLLKYLQGDFDCWFGGNANEVGGVQHLPHGDPANLRWQAGSVGSYGSGISQSFNLPTKALEGSVRKIIALREDHTAIYTQTLNQVDARLSVGHHATINIPQGDGSYDVSTSPFIYAGTFPGAFTDGGGMPRLTASKEFNSLDELPLEAGGVVALNKYYATRGHEDLAMVSYDPKETFAWSAMTNKKEGYVFFTLKNPQVLASTIFWLSHFGRTEEPWSKEGQPRHGFVMGVEDITSLYCMGIAESLGQVPEYRALFDKLNKMGIKTFLDFNRDKPTPINYIMGVAPIQPGFEGVRSIEPEDSNLVSIVDKSGKHSSKTAINWSWLNKGDLNRLFN